MGKPLSEEMKTKISDLYNNSDMSIGSIADILDVSVDSVKRHKNYGYQEESVQPESYDHDTDSEDEIEDDEQETETIEDYEPSEEKSWPLEEVKECPECGKPKSECWTIDQALEQGMPVNEVAKQFYDYICPKDGRFFTDYRYRIQGICPGSGCHSTSRDWMPIEQHPYAKEEEIEKYDFICLECHELIKIVD